LLELRNRLAGVAAGVARVLQVNWGLGSRAKRRIYSGLIVPCAFFGASVCYRVARRGKFLKLLMPEVHRFRMHTGMPQCPLWHCRCLLVLLQWIWTLIGLQ